MASKGTVAWVPVLPSLTGFAAKLTSEATQAASVAGSNAGKAFSSTMNAAAANNTLTKQLKELKDAAAEAQADVDELSESTKSLRDAEKYAAQAVSTATSLVTKAREEQKTAALNVEAAEKRLQEAIEKNGENSSQTIAAQAKLNDARSKLRQKTEAVAKSEKTLTETQQEHKKTSAELTDGEKKLADASDKLKTAQSKLKDEQAKVDKKSHSLLGRFRQWASSANAAKNSSDRLSQSTVKLGDVSGKAAGKIGVLAGAAQTVFSKAWGAVSSSIGSAVERADMMNNFPKVMANIGFSATDAAKSVKKISSSLDGLPTASSAMTGMVQQLAPLTSSLDEATDISLALNNAMLAGGASTTEQENALTQYCQQLAAGKVDMAAWRSMQAAMPGQLNQLAESMLGAGKNANDLYEEMKDGKVSFQDFNKAVVKLNREGFGKYASFTAQARDATQGIGTAMENSRNRVSKAVQKIIDAFGVDKISGAINSFTSQFSKIGDVAANMVKRGISAFDSLGRKLKDTGAIDMLRNAWDKLVHSFDSVKWDKLLPAKTIESFGWLAAGAIGIVTENVSHAIDTIRGWAGKILEFIDGFTNTGVFDTFCDVVGSVIDVVTDVNDLFWECIQNMFGLNSSSGQMQSFGDTVGNVFKAIGEAVKPVIDRLDDMVNWCRDHSEYITSSLVGIGGAVAGWKIAATVAAAVEWFKKLPLAIAAVDTAVKISAAVFAAHPIGFIVSVVAAAVAALTYFFTQTETGKQWWANICAFMQDAWRNIGTFFHNSAEWFKGLWNGIRDAFRTGWDWIDSNVIQPLVAAWNWLGDAFKWVYDNIIQPVWEAIKTVFQVGFLYISTVVITPFTIAWNALSTMFKAVYENVIKPVWDWICSTFQTGWQWIDANVIGPFKVGWNLLVEAFKLVGEQLAAFWDAVVQALQAGWQWIDQWVIEPFKLGWKLLGDVFKQVGDAIGRIWQGIRDAFKSAWDWINQWVIGPFKLGLQVFADVFKQVGDRIGRIWQGIRDAFKSAWDWIDQHILKPFRDGLDRLGQVAANMKTAVTRAFDALKDAAATPVRWIVDVVYTNGIQKTWNGIAGAVGLDNLKLPDAPKFANGGVNPGYAPRRDTILSWTSPGEAIMVPEWTRAVGAANVHRWNRLARTQGAQAVLADMGTPRYADGGVAGLWDGVKTKVGQGWEWVKGKAEDFAGAVAAFFEDPAGWVTSKILDPVRSMLSGIGSGNWGTLIAQLPLKVAQGLVQKARDAIGGWLGAGSAKATQTGGQYHGAVGGVEQWRPQVLTVLKMLGQPASWADTVLRRMDQESGGNPNAINNWDINAINGVPSQGLMQTIPPTFAAYAGPFAGRPITDPLANIYAGCNYAIHRYGSLAGMNRPGGYSFGGIIGETATLYDKGGFLPAGRTVVENRTRQPELVLTHEQIREYFHAHDGETKDVNLTFNIPERGDPWSQADIWMREAKNVLGR